MSPVLASRCRRAAHHHLRLQNDNVWIPDSLLTATFEHFCAASRIVVRYGSSTPGPVESRRRMGKRRMGGLNLGQEHSAAPLWGLSNLSDLTQWQWKPPSSPGAGLRKPKVKNAQEWSLWKTMLNWHAEPVSGLHIWDTQTIPSEVIDTGLDLLRRDLTSDATTTTRPNFAEFCNSWTRSLADGLFTGQAICSVLDGIQQGLSMSPLDAEEPLERVLADKIRLSLLEATIAGLSCRGIHEHNVSDRLAWVDVFHAISGLQFNTLRVFTEAMDKIPDPYLSNVSAGIAANLRAYLVASGSNGKRSVPIRQVRKMAQALKKLDLANPFYILESGTQHVLMHRDSKDVNYSRMRLGWLQLLARLPSVNEGYLAKICSILEAGKDVEPLSNREICEMYVIKHRSSLKEVERLLSPLPRDDSMCYGRLGLALLETGEFDHVKGLCEFLGNLGREQDVIRLVKGLRNLAMTEATPMTNLAIGAGDPMLALDIFGLYEKSRRESTKAIHFWTTPFSAEALKLLTRSQSIRHSKILGVLHCSPRRIRRQGKGRLATVQKREAVEDSLKISKAAVALASSPRVTSRTSLKLISQCIRHLRSRDAALPPTVLQALLHIVTRDLEEGKPGRTTRLRYVLHLLRKWAGPDKMMQIGLAIKRWREVNFQRHRESIRQAAGRR
ncbi:hypothetical protein F4677DRAFT_439874 [Hypoxylon crocopeplum]|nr:hypothetical protein F4677DRAFT_439874 [Hypoxylon crocopeplum]